MMDNLKGGASVPLTILAMMAAWTWRAPALLKVGGEEEEEEASLVAKVLLRCGTAPKVMPSTHLQISSRGGASLMGGGRLEHIWEYRVLSHEASLPNQERGF